MSRARRAQLSQKMVSLGRSPFAAWLLNIESLEYVALLAQ